MKLTYIATVALIILVGAGVYLVAQNENEGKLQEMQAANDRMILDQKNKFDEKMKALEDEQRKLRDVAAAANAGGTSAIARTTPNPAGTDGGVAEGLNSVKKLVQKPGPEGRNPAPTPKPYVQPGDVAPEPPDLGPDPANGSLEPAPFPSDLATAEAKAKRAEQDLVYGPTGNDARIKDETDRLTNGGEIDTTGKLNQLQAAILNQPRIARVGDARAADRAGFVVLDEGANKGITKGDRFAVRRGTILVARVVIGTIEPAQCVADIVPNTLVAGMSVKNGDEIIKFDR